MLLYAIEEIHAAYPRRTDWLTAVNQEIAWHKTYVTSSYFEEWVETNSKYIRSLVDELRKMS
jgi:hypothetical protein